MEPVADQTGKRWVFGDYVVYCDNALTARRIYEEAHNRSDHSVLFGAVQLPEGCSGNWVHLANRKPSVHD